MGRSGKKKRCVYRKLSTSQIWASFWLFWEYTFSRFIL